MKTKSHSFQVVIIFVVLFLLTACAPAAASTPVTEGAANLSAEEPTSTPTPIPTPTSYPLPPLQPVGESGSGAYQPVSAEVCQILQESAVQSLGLTFTMETGTPFTDFVSGETGQACTLTATTNGASISNPGDALSKLVSGFVGWEENQQYAAGGPTGAATGMTRDMGLMLISVGWTPSADANCPADQPISACPLTPEQQLYTVKIEAAQK